VLCPWRSNPEHSGIGIQCSSVSRIVGKFLVLPIRLRVRGPGQGYSLGKDIDTGLETKVELLI
jgi:hypothetical protein